ncbi:MAG: hypothetical protein EOO15_19215 [Chitinophagaceae bacterium]|nr:MAG: hypothetical protein EOO15_19215 [Chitinophagaceae bacterium]
MERGNQQRGSSFGQESTGTERQQEQQQEQNVSYGRDQQQQQRNQRQEGMEGRNEQLGSERSESSSLEQSELE